MRPIEVELIEDEIRYNELLDLDYVFCSVRMVNGEELFSLVADDKDGQVVMRHPIRVQLRTSNGDVSLAHSRYNPFTSDELTRVRPELIHHLNVLSPRFIQMYQQVIDEMDPDSEEVDVGSEGPPALEASAITADNQPVATKRILH